MTTDETKRTAGMTVRQLREALADLPEEAQDKPVVYAYLCGDFWRTVLCGAVERVGERGLRWSGYHRAHALPDEGDGDGERDGEGAELSPAVVLS